MWLHACIELMYSRKPSWGPGSQMLCSLPCYRLRLILDGIYPRYSQTSCLFKVLTHFVQQTIDRRFQQTWSHHGVLEAQLRTYQCLRKTSWLDYMQTSQNGPAFGVHTDVS